MLLRIAGDLGRAQPRECRDARHLAGIGIADRAGEVIAREIRPPLEHRDRGVDQPHEHADVRRLRRGERPDRAARRGSIASPDREAREQKARLGGDRLDVRERRPEERAQLRLDRVDVGDGVLIERDLGARTHQEPVLEVQALGGIRPRHRLEVVFARATSSAASHTTFEDHVYDVAA